VEYIPFEGREATKIDHEEEKEMHKDPSYFSHLFKTRRSQGKELGFEKTYDRSIDGSLAGSMIHVFDQLPRLLGWVKVV
jgi:hypothetical protein